MDAYPITLAYAAGITFAALRLRIRSLSSKWLLSELPVQASMHMSSSQAALFRLLGLTRTLSGAASLATAV